MQIRSQLNTTLPRVIVIAIATVFVLTVLGTTVLLWSCSNCDASLVDWVGIFFAGIAIVLAVPGWIIMAVGLVQTVKNMFVMTAHVNDSFQDANWTYRFNRFNLVCAPRYLTEKGLVARKKTFKGFLTFFLGLAFWVPLILMQEFGF
jgi:hypothetical protein